MAITVVGTGSNQSKTAGTTITLGSANVAVLPGDVVVAVIGFDNTAAATPTITGFSGGATTTWTTVNYNSPQSASGGGIRTYVGWGAVTASGNTGLATTVTISASVTARAASFIVFRGAVTTPPSVTGTSSTGNYSTSSMAVSAGGWAVLGATTEQASVPTLTIGGTSPGTDTTASVTTTGGSAATNAAVGLRAREYSSGATGLAGTATITDGAGFWLEVAPTPVQYTAVGTVSSTSAVQGVLLPDQNILSASLLLTGITGDGLNIYDVPLDSAVLLIFSGDSYSGGSFSADVILGSTPLLPVLVDNQSSMYLFDPEGSGTIILGYETYGSWTEVVTEAYAINMPGGLLPAVVDTAVAYGSGGGLTFSIDTAVKGILITAVVTGDGHSSASAYPGTIDLDYVGVNGHIFAHLSPPSTTSNYSWGVSYLGGGVYQGDTGMAISLAPDTGSAVKQATGVVVASGGTSGAPTKRTQISGEVTGVVASSGAVTTRSSVSGVVVAVGVISGDAVKSSLPAGGVLTATAGVSGTVAKVTQGSGVISASGSATGTATKRTQAGSAVAGVAVVVGTPTKTTQVSGGTATLSTVSGSPSKRTEAVSTAVVGAATALGVATKNTVVPGTAIVVTSSTGGAPSFYNVAVSGTSAIASSSAGDVTVTSTGTVYQAAGTSASVSVVSGAVTAQKNIYPPGTELRRNLFRNPRPVSSTNHFSSSSASVMPLSVITGTYGGMVRSTRNTAGNYRVLDMITGTTVTNGERYSAWFLIRTSEVMNGIYIYFRPDKTTSTGQVALWSNGTIPGANAYYSLNFEFTVPSGTLTNSAIVIVQNGSTLGSTVDIGLVNVQHRAGTLTQADSFDGSSPATAALEYSWVGTPEDSASVALERGTAVAAVSKVIPPARPATLVAQYGFNEGTGQIAAGSGPEAVDLAGSDIYWGSGKYGTGFGDGITANPYASSALDTPNHDEVTHMMWVYYRGGSGGSAWWDSAAIMLDETSTTFRMSTASGPSTQAYFTVGLSSHLNSWVHIAITARRAVGTASIYVNGILYDTQNFLPHEQPASWAPEIYFHTETIDDWRIFDGILTPTEILAYSTQHVGGPLTGAGTVTSTSTVSGTLSKKTDRVRLKSTYSTGTSTSWSVNFDESTALDNTHLLVLVVGSPAGTTITTPSGWAQASTGYSVYAMQGDGVTNGVTVTTSSTTNVTLTLMAFKGFVSTTPLTQIRGDAGGTTSQRITIAPPWRGSYGVDIQFIERDSGMENSYWGGLGSFTISNDEPAPAQLRSVSQQWMGGIGISPNHTWLQLASSQGAIRSASVIYPLVEVNNSPAVVEAGPLASWGFGEGDGPYTANKSSNLVDLRTFGTPWSSSGHTGGGASSNGVVEKSAFHAVNPTRGATASDSYVYRGATYLPTFTVMAWIYVDAYPSVGVQSFNSAVFDHSSGQTIGVRADGKLSYAGYTSSYTVPLSTWVHVAITSDGETSYSLKTFINGVETDSVEAYAEVGGGNWMVGGNWQVAGIYGTGTPFLGKVDDVRIFDQYLDATAISAWKDTPVPSSVQYSVSGTTSSASAVAGTAIRLSQASGVLSTVSGALGGVTSKRQASGIIAAVSGAIGTLTNRSLATGAVSAVSVNSGAVTKRTAVQGISAAVSTSGGVSKLIGVASGVVDAASVVSGAPIKTTPASSTVAGISASIGAAKLIGVTSGRVDGLSGVTGSAANTGTQSGVIVGTSAAQGSITAKLLLAGTLTATGVTIGAPTSQRQASGVVVNVGTISGAPFKSTSASGSTTGVSATSGAPTNLAPVSGSAVQGVSSVSGAVTSRLPSSGVVTVTGASIGLPTKFTSAFAGNAALSASSGAPFKVTSAAGSSVGVSVVSGSVDLFVAISGAVAAVGATVGTPIKLTNASGVAVGVSSTAGTVVSGASLLAPSISATSTTSGSVTEALVVSGVSVVASSVIGTPTNRATVTGSMVATSNTTGNPSKRSQAASLEISSTSSTSGTLTLGAVAAGLVTATSTGSGSAAGPTDFSGVVQAVSASQGDIRKITRLSGASTGTSSAAGGVTTNLILSGSVTSVATTTDAVTKRTNLSATIIAVSGISGTATPPGSSSGVVDVDSGISGAPTKRTQGSAVAAAVSTVSGALTKSGPLAGTSSAVSAIAADFSKRSYVTAGVTSVSGIAGTIYEVSDATGEITVTSLVSGTVIKLNQVSGAIQNLSDVDGWLYIDFPMSSSAVLTTSTVLGTPTKQAYEYAVIHGISTVVGNAVRASTADGTVEVISTVIGQIILPESLYLKMNGQEIYLSQGSLFYKYNGVEYQVGLARVVGGAEVVYWTAG